ncbi:PREDICTED: uncharacterized protein LOC108663085 isoform X2 [Theobroma cacao]|uniref:Uncharacterized protein LOC108663085 isoform X2 n=1 Tax=Theobroma cacao TaxID=3641 RepID=A0AB32WTE2_THECC|nr:PREDICTED: uncharacterized protein LOC108663085 isoform X2 [Theobroma cacao]
MASKYIANSYVYPSMSRRDLKNSMVEVYEAFKKDECASVKILGDQGVEFFTTLKDLKEGMTSEQIDASLSILCKRMIGSKSKLYNTRACVVDTIFFHIQLKMDGILWKFQMGCEVMWRVISRHTGKNGRCRFLSHTLQCGWALGGCEDQLGQVDN